MFKGNFDINLDFLKLKSPPLIGVDISSSSVKMVELSMIGKDNQAYRIERYVIESLPADAMQDGGIANMEAVTESLRRGWKRMGTRQKNVALALPATDVITKKIVVPAGQREEDLVFQEENEVIPYDSEDPLIKRYQQIFNVQDLTLTEQVERAGGAWQLFIGFALLMLPIFGAFEEI